MPPVALGAVIIVRQFRAEEDGGTPVPPDGLHVFLVDGQHLGAFTRFPAGGQDDQRHTGIHDQLARPIVAAEVEFAQAAVAEAIGSQPNDHDLLLDRRVQHQGRRHVRDHAQAEDIHGLLRLAGDADEIAGCGVLRIEAVRIFGDAAGRPLEDRILPRISGDFQHPPDLLVTQLHTFGDTVAAIVVFVIERCGVQRQDAHLFRGQGIGDGILVIHLVERVAVDDDILHAGGTQILQNFLRRQPCGGNAVQGGASREKQESGQEDGRTGQSSVFSHKNNLLQPERYGFSAR